MAGLVSLADACMPILSQVMVRHAIPRCQPLRPCEEAAMVGGGHVIVSHGHTRDMKVLILREQPVAASWQLSSKTFMASNFTKNNEFHLLEIYYLVSE